MKDTEKILLYHAGKYPRMAHIDAVKLLYQSEFGGGHMIRDEKSCMDHLLREYHATAQSSLQPLTEEIGGGFVRVHLSALDAHGYSVSALGQDFIRSASLSKGTMAAFEKKLQLLEILTEAERMPFPWDRLALYLGEYRAAGCPMVSHSEVYRLHYHPAYRVVRKECLPECFR